jgi:hypothetical protein
MAMKVGEFMRLTQGTRTMKEYLHAFNNLSRYALEFVNTDAKKMASFKRGFNPKMLKTMGTSSRTMFNKFISDCLTQENNNNAYSASKSRKRAFELGLSQPKAPMANRSAYRSPARVQGSDRLRRETRICSHSRGIINLLRWQYLKQRQDKTVHLELLLQ